MSTKLDFTDDGLHLPLQVLTKPGEWLAWTIWAVTPAKVPHDGSCMPASRESSSQGSILPGFGKARLGRMSWLLLLEINGSLSIKLLS